MRFLIPFLYIDDEHRKKLKESTYCNGIDCTWRELISIIRNGTNWSQHGNFSVLCRRSVKGINLYVPTDVVDGFYCFAASKELSVLENAFEGQTLCLWMSLLTMQNEQIISLRLTLLYGLSYNNLAGLVLFHILFSATLVTLFRFCKSNVILV